MVVLVRSTKTVEVTVASCSRPGQAIAICFLWSIASAARSGREIVGIASIFVAVSHEASARVEYERFAATAISTFLGPRRRTT